MDNTFVKLYRSLDTHELLQRDNTCLVVFIKLLLTANWMSGEVTIGRNRLAAACNMKPSTVYSALKRLQKSNVIQMQSNSTSTRIFICNWAKYQQNGKQTINDSSTNIVTIKRTKKKNKNIDTNVSKSKSVEVQQIYDLFINSFEKNKNQYKLTDSRKAKIRTRLNDAGYEMLEKAITNVSKDSFYRGDNDRGWTADLDFIIRSYEQVEKLSNIEPSGFTKEEKITGVDLSTAGLTPEEIRQMEGR